MRNAAKNVGVVEIATDNEAVTAGASLATDNEAVTVGASLATDNEAVMAGASQKKLDNEHFYFYI